MACNKDSNCKNIANDYASKKGGIDSSLSSMKESISMIGSSLNSFSVPDDYIGSKVMAKLSNISGGLEGAVGGVDSYKSGVDGFIDQKKAEHEDHYNTWKAAQDALKAKKKKEDGDEDDT